MLEMVVPSVLSQIANLRTYAGPERRSASATLTRWLTLMLDEIDYGLVLVGDDAQLLHANHAAKAEMDCGHPLRHLERAKRSPAQAPIQELAPLHEALNCAQRGLRRLISLTAEGERFSLAVVPLGPRPGGSGHATLLVLGKREVCQSLSVQWFARAHALTPAETRVLEALCRGLDPREVATLHHVGMATVRTQIGSIRAKTGAESIRELVRMVAVLPPMLSSLRAAA